MLETENMVIRDIVHIDLEKCDGCGLCVPSCEEGAIQIRDGKARVVSDVYCDGLGACLGHCPRDAISIVRREAAAFDVVAVARHLKPQHPAVPSATRSQGCPAAAAHSTPTAERGASKANLDAAKDANDQSRLANWPVQLHLVPPGAPYLHQAGLLLVADCVPLACADFHSRILDGRPVVIGCPKLDDCSVYVEKLAAIIAQSGIPEHLGRPYGGTMLHRPDSCCPSGNPAGRRFHSAAQHDRNATR